MITSGKYGALLLSNRTMNKFRIEMIYQAQYIGIHFAVCFESYPEHTDVLIKLARLAALTIKAMDVPFEIVP